MADQPSSIRYRLADHIIGQPSDPPRWAEEPWLRRKRDLQEGFGTTVAVLDSGISRHPWLRGSYRSPLAFDAIDLWDMSAEALPRHVGHGTFVAGVVLQYAPRTTILSRRVVDLDGEANDPDLAAIIDGLYDLDPDVVNLSLAPIVEPGTLDEGTSKTLSAISRLQEAKGTVVVVAAGNNGERFPEEHLAPAHELTVVVGASDLSGRRAWFSNRHFVNIWAPGVDVLSSFVHWDGPVEPADDGDDHPHAEHARPSRPVRPVAPFAGWARWNGTSFAAPAVAGAIATEIGALTDVTDRKERRRIALDRVYGAARDIEVDGEKGKALTATPVAMEGPPRADHHAGHRPDDGGDHGGGHDHGDHEGGHDHGGPGRGHDHDGHDH